MSDTETGFKLLHEPISLGSLTLKHRLCMGPMWTRMCTAEGEVSQQQIEYYSARARGGAALIIIEAVTVDSRHGWPEPTLCIDNAKYLPRLGRLAESIHRNGASVFLELAHLGSHSSDPVSPSGVPSMMHGAIGFIQPRVMSIEEIEDAREKFITAAARAQEIGYDGVLIHGASAYLLHHFFSPQTNKRTDKYGGTLQNRMQLSLEIVQGIRKKCGPNFVIGYDLVADDFVNGGVNLEQTIPFAKALAEAGIDYLDSMLGTYETLALDERSAGTLKYGPKGMWEYAARFKEVLNIPVISRTLMDYDPINWDRHLEAGHADAVQLAKPSLCDPEIFNKVLSYRFDDIRPCTCCVYCTDRGVIRHFQVSCAMNPELSREKEYLIQPATKTRKVLVIGGGPGGLEAARVASLRGHDVTLVEKESEPGGTVRTMSLCIGNEIHARFIDWLVRECGKTGVKFEFNKEGTPELVKEFEPDVVILSIGANVPVIPPIPGVSKGHVVNVEDVLRKKIDIGSKVVVIGGSRIGADTAYTIVKKGWAQKITIVEQLPVPTIGYDMEILNKARLVITLLPKYGVQALTGTQIEEISDNCVVVKLPEGQHQKIEADTVILAMGSNPNNTLYESLKSEITQLYRVGDCIKARSVADAVHDAACIARQI